MSESALDKFGKLLIESLRDQAIDHFDRLAAGRLRAPNLAELQEGLKSLPENERNVARRCVESAIDNGIHDFLFAIQEIATYDNNIQLIVDGEDIIKLSDGLSGELFSTSGWIAKYSKHK